LNRTRCVYVFCTETGNTPFANQTKNSKATLFLLNGLHRYYAATKEKETKKQSQDA
jgi:hypothetical protein